MMEIVTLVAVLITAVASLVAAGFSISNWRTDKRDALRVEAVKARLDHAASYAAVGFALQHRGLWDVCQTEDPLDPPGYLYGLLDILGMLAEGFEAETASFLDQIADPELMKQAVTARQSNKHILALIHDDDPWTKERLRGLSNNLLVGRDSLRDITGPLPGLLQDLVRDVEWLEKSPSR